MKLSRKLILGIILACIALAAAWLGFRYYSLIQAEQRCLENAHALQLSINSQIAQLGEESIADPGTISASVKLGKTSSLPDFSFTNPFTRQPGTLVAPGESCRPGDLLVVAADAYFFLGYTDPAQEEISAIYPGFYVIALGIRPRADIGFPGYLDTGADGFADPVIGWFDGMHINRGSTSINIEYEPLTDALLRQGVQLDQISIQRPLGLRSPFWRYLLGLDVY